MTDNSNLAYAPIDKEKVKTQIYEIRGYKVMVDNTIASYFGIETKALNRAMKRNIKRFPKNFCFQLTKEEYHNILRCQFGTLELEQGKFSKYLPYVYTETGVAMLTSTLHTDRAIEASIQIMEAFVEMSHFIRQNKDLLPDRAIETILLRHEHLQGELVRIKANMVTKSDLAEIMSLFETGISSEEILILDGEPFTADIAFQKIYRSAQQSIIVIDDYLAIKTLLHLTSAKSTVEITIVSDNKGNHPLRQTDQADFQAEYPSTNIRFVSSQNRTHDRYIVIDFDTNHMRVFHCGASSKDAGRKITTITELKEPKIYISVVKELLTNPPLELR
ncbi:MAG: ORF6N domain-containing protein [Clostridiales bacterium]|nr:ORF6N domain-containing protein [Clostridiales bacterium]